jgi:hypothetical protein
LPGVYSTIWCLWYKTNKLKKRRKEGSIEPDQIGWKKPTQWGSQLGHGGIASSPARARIRCM